jgi:hypothetical protein
MGSQSGYKRQQCKKTAAYFGFNMLQDDLAHSFSGFL